MEFNPTLQLGMRKWYDKGIDNEKSHTKNKLKTN